MVNPLIGNSDSEHSFAQYQIYILAKLDEHSKKMDDHAAQMQSLARESAERASLSNDRLALISQNFTSELNKLITDIRVLEHDVKLKSGIISSLIALFVSGAMTWVTSLFTHK